MSSTQTSKKSKEIIVVKEKIKPKKKKQKKQRQNSNVKKNCYAAVLNNPFSAPPCRLGWGTMVSTQLGSVSFRGTVSTNADGSLAIFCQPVLGTSGPATTAPILANSSGANTATWTGSAWQNLSQYPSSLCTEIRPISLGMRVTPLVAQTAAPGIIYAGQVSGINTATMVTYSPTNIAGLTSLNPMISCREPILITSRPIDNTAYEFLISNFQGSTTNTWSNSTVVASLLGFPASANIMIDIIFHFEYIPIQTTSNTRLTERDVSVEEEKVSSYFPSQEEAWAYTVERLNPSAIFDITTSLLNLATASQVRGMLNGGNQRRLQ